MPCLKVISLHSTFYDFGIFENAIYLVDSSANFFSYFIAGHNFAFFPVYTWVLNFIPIGIQSLALVGIQSILLALPIPFLYSRFGFFIAFSYIAYSPLWANALFDFHFDHLAVPFLLGFYLLLLNRRIILCVICAVLLMLVKEPFALASVACGFILLIIGLRRKSNPIGECTYVERLKLISGGVFLIILGAIYFFITVNYLIPYFSYGHEGHFDPSDAFSWLGGSLSDIGWTILLEPHKIIYEILATPSKLVYICVIFGSLLFIPLLYPLFLLPALPIILIALISRVPNHFDYSAHYTAGLIIPVMFSYIYGFPRAKKISEYTLSKLNHLLFNYFFKHKCLGINKKFRKLDLFIPIAAIFITSSNILFSFSPISRIFLLDKSWSYGYQAYIPTERDRIIKAQITKIIPSDPSISVSTQNTVNLSHLARRNIYLAFPQGVMNPITIYDWSYREPVDVISFMKTGMKAYAPDSKVYADFIVLDLKRPYFVTDKGCEWIYGGCKNKKIEKDFFEFVSNSNKEYSTIFMWDDFIILRRRKS